MSPERLFESYKMFGEDPFIAAKDATVNFSAWEYAKERSKQIAS